MGPKAGHVCEVDASKTRTCLHIPRPQRDRVAVANLRFSETSFSGLKQMFVKVPLILLIVGIITVVMMRLVGGIVTRRAALINSWILMLAACIQMFVALRDLSRASQRASVALLTVQLLVLCSAWFAVVSSPVLMISSRDRREKIVLVVQYIVIVLMTIFYHR